MARQTRAQRRARREARQQEPVAAPPRAEPRAGNGGAGGAAERRPVERAHAERAGFGPFRFVHESWGELQKVEWPTQNQLVQGTVVVLIACIIVGVYLWACDEAFRRLVQQVFI